MSRARSKVLILEQQTIVAGGQVVFLELVDAYLRLGASVTVALPTAGGALLTLIRRRFRGRVQVVDIVEPVQSDAAWERRFEAGSRRSGRRLIRRLSGLSRFDVVHVNASRWFPVMLDVVRVLAPGRVLYHFHTAHSAEECRLLAWLLDRQPMARLLVVSRFLSQHAKQNFPARHQTRIQLLENPLPARFRLMNWVDRHAESEPSRVALIGRVCRDKGHEMLPELAARLPEMEFHVVGPVEPPEVKFLAELQERCPGNVYFWPAVLDVRAWVKATGVQYSLVPSRWEEGFGLVLIESLAMSLITLSTRRGALSEHSLRTGTFLFDEPETAAKLLGRIHALGPAQRRSIARRQYEAVQKQFAFDRFVVRLHSLSRTMRTVGYR